MRVPVAEGQKFAVLGMWSVGLIVLRNYSLQGSYVDQPVNRGPEHGRPPLQVTIGRGVKQGKAKGGPRRSQR